MTQPGAIQNTATSSAQLNQNLPVTGDNSTNQNVQPQISGTSPDISATELPRTGTSAGLLVIPPLVLGGFILKKKRGNRGSIESANSLLQEKLLISS